jgi:hypothetical protein
MHKFAEDGVYRKDSSFADVGVVVFEVRAAD